MTSTSSSSAMAILAFAKVAVLAVLAFLAWQWWNTEPPPPAEPSTELLARLDELDKRLRSKSLIDVDAELGRLHKRLDDLEKMLAAPASAFAGPIRPNEGAVAGAETVERKPIVMGNAMKAGARAQADVVVRHVKGVSKSQLGRIQNILLEAKSREAAAYDELRGLSNPALRLGPILEEIRMERYQRLSEVLDADQMRQLAEVPLPLVPRSMVGAHGPDGRDSTGGGDDEGGSR